MKPKNNSPLGKIILLLAIVSGLASIYALPESVRNIWVLVLLSLSIIILIIWIIDIIKKGKQFDIWVFEDSEFTRKPASLSDIRWIARLENRKYSVNDAVPYEKLKEWYQANQNGFSLILENNKRIGHVDILPIKNGDKLFEKYCEGAICEIDIPGTSIAPPEERDSVENIYVESIIIDPERPSIIKFILNPFNAEKPRFRVRQAPIRYLLSSLVPIVRDVANPNNVKYVYAMAATKVGKHFMNSLGFDLETPADERKDGHDLYKVSLPVLTERIGNRLKYTVIQERQEFELLIQKAEQQEQ